MMKQVIELTKNPSIIIATPGAILNHLKSTKGFNLDNLKYFVLDEADKLLNMDFEKQIN
jgi:ATP-dependent RNA helicase DDX47/RRP3